MGYNELKNVKVSEKSYRKLLELKSKHEDPTISMGDLMDEILFNAREKEEDKVSGASEEVTAPDSF